MVDPAIARFATNQFDPDRFNGRPWLDVRRSHDDFVEGVRAALARTGRWATSGERAMGGEIDVSVEHVRIGQTAVCDGEFLSADSLVYEVAAEYGVRISARYATLEEALGCLSVFADLTWDLVCSGTLPKTVFSID